MNKITYAASTILCLAACTNVVAQTDIYDILRGTTSKAPPSISIEDVQDAAASSQQAQSLAADTAIQVQPTTLREEAFKQLINQTYPLKPDQIQELHRHHDITQQAIQAPPFGPPQPVSSTLNVDLAPGGLPPVIRLATGFVTSIVFLDSTGAPWPVSDYSLGNPAGFNLKWDNKTNTLFIQSTQDHISGNLAVRLAELDTPVMISIVTGQREVDYRVDMQVPGEGPNAEAPLVDSLTVKSVSPTLLNVLDGIPPSGSIELKVAAGYGQAWSYNGKILFRTKLTLLSPAWSATVSSADGTRVYELMQTPLLLASKNGKTIKIELAGM